MGMLFNTPGTLRILATANAACSGRHFKRLRGGAPFDEAKWRALPTGGGIYAVIASVLDIDDDDPIVSMRWQKWLGLLDTQPAVGGPKWSNVIGNAMADAVVGKSKTGAALTFAAIEFFAVPAGAISVSVEDLPEPVVGAAPQTYTKAISVFTLTVDKLATP